MQSSHADGVPLGSQLYQSAKLFEEWTGTIPQAEAIAYRTAMRAIDRVGPESATQIFADIAHPEGPSAIGKASDVVEAYAKPAGGRLLDIINAVACGTARMQLAQVVDLPFIERTGNARNATDLHLVLGILSKSIRHAVLRTPVGETVARDHADVGYHSEVEGPWCEPGADPHAPRGGEA